MIIELELRDGTIKIPKKEFEDIFDFNWFLGNLTKYDENSDTTIQKYCLWESKNTVLAILDSLRYNKLIIYDNDLDYLYALSDKWCVPEWLKTEILLNIEKKKINNDFTNNMSFKCLNCGSGFKISENKNDSCKTHRYSLCAVTLRFSCCGKHADAENNYCISGYHILSDSDKDKLIKLNNLEN